MLLNLITIVLRTSRGTMKKFKPGDIVYNNNIEFANPRTKDGWRLPLGNYTITKYVFNDNRHMYCLIGQENKVFHHDRFTPVKNNYISYNPKNKPKVRYD